MLQCVAVCCDRCPDVVQLSIYSALQCVAVCCSVLQCVAVCCSVLQCVAVCCSVLQGVVIDNQLEKKFAKVSSSQRHLLQCSRTSFSYVGVVYIVYIHNTYLSVPRYSQSQVGRHKILRLFLKTLNLVPGVPSFSCDL